MAKFCHNCGSPLEGAPKFCPSCGTPLMEMGAPQQQEMPTPPQEAPTPQEPTMEPMEPMSAPGQPSPEPQEQALPPIFLRTYRFRRLACGEGVLLTGARFCHKLSTAF